MEKRSKNSPDILAITCARNEEAHITKTVVSLQKQTLPIKRIIVVNDGSTDATGEIAKELGCTVINLPFHKESYVGKPDLARIYNTGLKVVNKHNPDYILIVGADHALPPDYIEQIIKRMVANPKLVDAGGYVEGEDFAEHIPKGSGSVINASFWKKLNNTQFPVCWGWESWLPLKATQLGYETKCFRDVRTPIQRPMRIGKVGLWGKAMYALGYNWKYALARSFIYFVKSPKVGMSMFWNYMRHKDVERMDVADWTNQIQKKRFWRRLKEVIKSRGRK